MGKAKSSDKGGKPTEVQSPREAFMALIESEETPPVEPQPTPPADEKVVDDDDAATDDDDDLDDDDEVVDDDDDSAQDDDDDDDDGDDDEDEYTFKVVVDGEEKEIDSGELVKGYQRQSDYSRKTAALAENRKEFEAEQGAVQAERTRYAGLLDKMEAALESTMPKPEDLEKLRSSNPGEYAARKADLQEHQRKLDATKAEKVAVNQKQMETAYGEYQKVVAQERTKLKELIPEWKDAEVARKDQDALAVYAQTQGWTADELAQVVDHRSIIMLRKAMQFDKLQSKKPAIRKKTKRVPTLKPGAKKLPKKKVKEAQRTRAKLTESGSVFDAADVMIGILEAE